MALAKASGLGPQRRSTKRWCFPPGTRRALHPPAFGPELPPLARSPRHGALYGCARTARRHRAHECIEAEAACLRRAACKSGACTSSFEAYAADALVALYKGTRGVTRAEVSLVCSYNAYATPVPLGENRAGPLGRAARPGALSHRGKRPRQRAALGFSGTAAEVALSGFVIPSGRRDLNPRPPDPQSRATGPFGARSTGGWQSAGAVHMRAICACGSR